MSNKYLARLLPNRPNNSRLPATFSPATGTALIVTGKFDKVTIVSLFVNDVGCSHFPPNVLSSRRIISSMQAVPFGPVDNRSYSVPTSILSAIPGGCSVAARSSPLAMQRGYLSPRDSGRRRLLPAAATMPHSPDDPFAPFSSP